MTNSNSGFANTLLFIVGISAVSFGISGVISHSTKTQVGIVRISNTERIVSSGGKSSIYLVWTEVQGQKEVFANKDSFWFGKFNSSDFQGEFAEAKSNRNICFNMEVSGFRVPVFSWYRNIVNFQKVQCPNSFNGGVKPIL